MATTQLSRTPSFGGPATPGSMSRTRDILIETMQLVEPRKEVPVPNHLLESKIYSKVAQNAVVQARPSVLHFGGFEPGKTVQQVLRLANVSSDVQRMHIIPPQTKYFCVKYKKGDRLVPGLTLDCVIEFYPDEWRYYYDCIRIHSAGEENLIIPIHAYPVMNTSEFPSHVDFPLVPLGQSKSKKFPLRSQAPIDFEFQLHYVQPHPAFVVDPLAGIVPANGDIDLTVTFSPTQFQTAHMKLQLVISQFNSRPMECTFTGSSAPGLKKEESERSALSALEPDVTMTMTLDPRAISPLDRARRKRTLKKSKTTSRGTLLDDTPQEIEFAGLKFPINMNTPHAVAQVLNQEPGKLRIKDLREVVLSKKGSSGAPTRQMKEAMFEMAVRQDVYEERQNQLRWQVKLGDEQITPELRLEVLQDREDAWNEYKLKRGDPVTEVECGRSCLDCAFRRTRRDASNTAQEVAQFDTYTNDMWAVRHATLARFQQAARTVIIRKRAERKLNSLRQMMLDWGNKKYNQNVTALEKEKQEEEEEQSEALNHFPLTVPKVKGFTFPTYAPPNVKDDMAVDSLGQVPSKPTDVVVRKKTPFFPLKVAKQHRIQGYKSHSIHEASIKYVPHDLVRPLRTGAEDEIISLPVPALTSSPTQLTLVNEGDMKMEDVTEATLQLATQPSEAVPLVPPGALFKPIDYPPLHIFNAAPGLQVFQPPLPYAETDQDFHLCPLPRYTNMDSANPHMATQKQFLDREDVIKGVMSWKRFPSQGLTSLANTPTLTNVWVPRWNEPYGTEVLPQEVPPLFEGLTAEDKQAILDESGDDVEAEETKGEPVQLTPEMVNAQFALIDPHATTPDDRQKREESFPFGSRMPQTNIPVSSTGPVPREKREQELEYFLKKKYNRLGNKIQGKVQHLNNIKTNPDLTLQ